MILTFPSLYGANTTSFHHWYLSVIKGLAKVISKPPFFFFGFPGHSRMLYLVVLNFWQYSNFSLSWFYCLTRRHNLVSGWLMPKQNPILFPFGDSLNEGCIRKPNDLLGFYVDSGRQMKYVSDNWHLITLGIIGIVFSWLLRQETEIQPSWGATNYAWQEWDMVTDHIMLRASLKSLQTNVTFITVAQQDCTQMCRDEQTQQPKKFEGKNCLLTFQPKTKNYAWQGWVGDCNLMRVLLIKSFRISTFHVNLQWRADITLICTIAAIITNNQKKIWLIVSCT